MIQNLVLGIPSYRSQIRDEHVKLTVDLGRGCAMMEMIEESYRRSKPGGKLVLPSAQPWGLRFLGRQPMTTCSIARSRNKLVSHALRARADWLLMVDADNWCDDHAEPRPDRLPQPAIFRMLKTAYLEDAAVIAAPVLRRDGRYNVQSETATLDREQFAGQVVPVARAGAAFMALNLCWLRDHWGKWDPADPWFLMRPTTDANGEPDEISEDHVLCDGVRARAGKVLCDGRFEPDHEGAPNDRPALVALGKAIIGDLAELGDEEAEKHPRTRDVLTALGGGKVPRLPAVH